MRAVTLVSLASLVACGEDPASAELLIVEPELAFGHVFCGATATEELTVVNTGEADADVTVQATLPGTTVMPATATIAPGQHQTFEVAVKMPELGTPGFAWRGDLRVTSDWTEYRVPLRFETAGISVALGSPRIIDFGELPPNSYAIGSASFFTTNVGVPVSDVAIHVGYPSARGFEVTQASGGYIGIMLEGGATARRHEATLTATITGEHLCSPRQHTLDLVGVVSNDPVQADNLALDLGEVGACRLASASTTLMNHGPSSQFTAVIDDASGWLQWDGASSGNLDGAQLRLSTKPGAERPAAGPFEARATITHATGTKTIPIRAFVHGHTATPLADTLELGNVSKGKTVTRKVTVENTGTVVASIDATSTNATVSPQAMQIEPGASRDLWVAYTAKNAPGTAIAGKVEIRFGPICPDVETIELRGQIVD